jgi:hypothetical protein
MIGVDIIVGDITVEAIIVAGMMAVIKIVMVDTSLVMATRTVMGDIRTVMGDSKDVVVMTEVVEGDTTILEIGVDTIRDLQGICLLVYLL